MGAHTHRPRLLGQRIARDAQGQRTSIVFPSGVKQNVTYLRRYGFDASGNRTST